MIKSLLKVITFTFISLMFSQYATNGLDFGDNPIFALILVIIGLILINVFIQPVLKIISFSDKGFVFFFLYAVVCFITIYIFSAIVPTFKINSVDSSSLLILGFVLPSNSLSPVVTAGFSALYFCASYRYLSWISSKK